MEIEGIAKPAGNNRGHFIQFVKYGISGGIATSVHIILFYFLSWMVFPSLASNDPVAAALGLHVTEVTTAIRSINSMLSNATAFICSNMTAYLINIAWVFTPGRHHRLVEIGLFYLVSGTSVLIGTIIMGGLIRYLGMQTTFAFSANVVCSAMINYGMRKFFIFKG